jgi:hypothetical protein
MIGSASGCTGRGVTSPGQAHAAPFITPQAEACIPVDELSSSSLAQEKQG